MFKTSVEFSAERYEHPAVARILDNNSCKRVSEGVGPNHHFCVSSLIAMYRDRLFTATTIEGSHQKATFTRLIDKWGL